MGGGNNFAIFKATQAEQSQFSFDYEAMPMFAETLVRLLYQPPQHMTLPQQYLSKDITIKYEKWSTSPTNVWKIAGGLHR